MTAPRTKSRRKKPAWVRKTKLTLIWLFNLGALAFVIFGAYFWTQLNWAKSVIPNLNTDLTELSTSPTVIWSGDGEKLFVAQSEYREEVAIESVPKTVIHATLAAEDKRFRDHHGIDWWGVGRAIFTNVREGRTAQGASTITMQLAKRMYTSSERSFTRKVKDMALAVQLEQTLTKDQILEIYLNQVFYGSGAYGIRAAAKTYFGKDLDGLTIGEAALLARIVRRPSEENPFVNLDKALENRNVVLRTMLDEGWISLSEYEEARYEKPKLRPKTFASGEHIKGSPYFVRYVLDTLKRELPEIDVTKGGYRIETTIDADLDKLAQKKVQEVVRKYRRMKVTTGAFVLIDDEGRILAMAGGVDYDRNQYNVIYQGRRQPGSSFKPFVYSAALATGALGFHDTVSNEQLVLDEPGKPPRRWPKNSRARYGGRVSIRTAIASSINVPAVRVCELVTPQVAANYARDVFGFKSPLDPVLSLALGSSSVSPLEMAQGYSVFMNWGDRVKPYGIKRVIGPDGEVVKEWEPEVQKSILSLDVCEKMDECLRAVVTGGTATKANAVPDARGKTGTTSDNRDAWFCGYSRGLLGIGWVGNEQFINGKWEYPPMQSSAFGGTITVDIWTGVMKEAVAKRGKKEDRPRDRSATYSDPVVEPAQDEPPIDDVTGGDPPAPPPDLPPLDPNFAPKPGEEFPADRVPPTKSGDPPQTPPNSPREVETVDVEICVETGLRANRYCPETVTRTHPRAEAPRRRCSMHGP